MEITAIDIGNYSVKILEGTLDKKTIKIHEANEIILSKFKKNSGLQLDTSDLQIKIVA